VQPVRPAFRVETFEYVDAGPELALLRLAGRWAAGHPPGGLVLVAVAGGERVELPPLPAPPAAEGVWRAAFSVDADLLDAAFELEPPVGEPIPLPAPVEQALAGAEPVVEEEVEPEPQPDAEEPHGIFGRLDSARRGALKRALSAEREARKAAERTAADERARAERAEAALREQLLGTLGKAEELIERIDGIGHTGLSFAEELEALRAAHATLLGEVREEAATELAAARGELEATRAELASAREQIDAVNHHLDTAHEAHAIELSAARTQRDAALDRQSRLERQLADALGDLEAFRGRVERARAEAAEGAAHTAELETAVERLHEAIAAVAREPARPARRFARGGDDVERSREELRDGLERLEELERQAAALRDAIHSQLSHHSPPSPLQEALPLSDDEALELNSTG
jgi:hypothetical protein